MNKPVVFFDLETDSLELDCQIIQLGAVAMKGDRIVDQFEAKLKFDESKSNPEALKLNGYSKEAWINAVEPAVVCKQFAKWLEPYKVIEKISNKKGTPFKVAKLAGFNAPIFDVPRLQSLFKQHDVFLPADYRILDVMQMALWYFELTGISTPESLKLSKLCEYFGVPLTNAHDALADVIATAALSFRIGSLLVQSVANSIVLFQNSVEAKLVHGIAPTRRS